jgi:hypothetical protein
MSYGAVDSCNTRVADTTQNKYGTAYPKNLARSGGPPDPEIFLFLFLRHTHNAPPGLYCTVQVRYWKDNEPLLAAGLPTPPALPQPIQSGRKPTKKNQPPRKTPKYQNLPINQPQKRSVHPYLMTKTF